MPGRRLWSEGELARGQPADSVIVRRRAVLRGTLEAIERDGERLRAAARRNVERWREAAEPPPGPMARVFSGDWGEVTARLTREHGQVFAVLNMANAYVPGGAYVEGAAAQEENMFRRTDCHFSVLESHMRDDDHYTEAMTALLSAEGEKVYLDVERPRICLRGQEDRSAPDLGYRWLGEDEVFPFYELRAAAVDLRDERPFDEAEMRRRVEAQLDTLTGAGLRHAVLGAFGCGAFRNPAAEVARLYREALEARPGAFELVAFAVFDAGYGPDNFAPFRAAFADSTAASASSPGPG